MAYRRFEELPVWNDAARLAVEIMQHLDSRALQGYSGLREQLHRAVVSISNNIAEGFERGTHEDLLHFLDIARGSAGEVRSMLRILERLPAPPLGPGELASMLGLAESISRQLGGWISSIRDSGFSGRRELDPGQRQSRSATQRQEAFLSRLEAIVARGPAGHDPSSLTET